MDDLEKELKVCFLDEAAQLIEDAEKCFLDLENNHGDISIIEQIFRLAHNLKGSSRAVGFNQMAEFTHVFESVLLKLKTQELQVDSNVVSVLLRCIDHLRGWVAELKGDLAAVKDSAELIQALQDIISGKSQVAATPAPAPTPEPVVPVEAPAPVIEVAPEPTPQPIAESLPDMAPVEPSSWGPIPSESAFKETAETVVHAAATASAPAPTPAPAPAPVAKPDAPKSTEAAKAASAEDESVRVSLSRLEKLVNFVGELVILQTVLNQHRHQIESPLLNRTIAQLAKITKDIQDLSMSLRMVPLKQTFQKMQRIVRDTSKMLNKEINFKYMGENTEVDKTVVEQLGDPLVHLVRNSVDHGIESAEERVAAGKPPAGSVTLDAYHKGGQIVIDVRDDGRGLDPDKLRAKAIEKGIIRPEQNLTKEECCKLIFAPGFSTKTEVTQVSGRGVGMDVVKTNIEKVLQGEIEIISEVGKGTCIRVKLPLTLAIIDGMVVQANEERYVLPLGHVHESIQPEASDIHMTTNLGEVLSLRGEELPLLRLSHMLGRRPKNQTAVSDCIAIVVRAGERPFSILVDDILGQQQIVIKKLGGELKNMKGIAGGAILGDGRAALILDLAELAARNLKGASA